MSGDGTSWRLTLPCSRVEGEAVAESPDLAGFDPAPVVVASEPDPDAPDQWCIDVYVDREPDAALVAAVRALAPGTDAEPAVERLAPADWVMLSQSGLEPVRAGRFFVHTAAHAGTVPPHATAFLIEAAQAFGTGHHETTRGCLEMLDGLAAAGARFDRIADIGTGTGLLAFAARSLWPAARVVASDIDPVAIDVTAENMAANAIPGDAIDLVVAEGMNDPRLAATAPYDLLIANILAAPLIALAPELARATAAGGTVILAGLLATQAADVIRAFAAEGVRLAQQRDLGVWAVLALVHQA